MSDLIDAYCTSMRRANLAVTTIDKRFRYLRLFEAECGLEASREEIETFLDRYKHPKSKATVLSHINTFYRWAADEGLIAVVPTAKIKAPKVPRKLPRPMAEDLLEKALANATPELRCWLLLGALAGLRCMEVAGVDVEDILDGGQMLRVTDTKGGNERLVPLHEDVREALLQVAPESGPMFRQRSGRQVTAGDVSHRLGAYLHGQGIADTPHSLRHFFATEVQRATHDVRTTQALMGHKSIASTAIYMAFDQEAGRVAVMGLRGG